MKKNVGKTDKIIRISIAVIIALLYSANLISGTWAIVLGILAVISAATSFVGYCPLYLPFGINTSEKKALE